MSKQVLDLEQMLHLREMGLELKETTLIYAGGGGKYGLFLTKQIDKILWESTYPAYTLQDVLELLPIEIKPCRRFWLRIDLSDDCIYYYYEDYNLVERRKKTISYNGMNGLIDAAYSMLCWAIENKFVETNKNE